MPSLYLLAYRSDTKVCDRELAEAECRALTGAVKAADRVFVGPAARIAHSAYVKLACEVLAEGRTVAECCERLSELDVDMGRFHVGVQRVPDSVDVRSVDAAVAVGRCVRGRADMGNPQTRLLVVATPERVWVGKVVERGEQRWRRHVRKPHASLRGLPADAARAAINMVAERGRTLLDPCCGAGTALIEAFDLGLRPWGVDASDKMVSVANANLAHFGMARVAELGDALKLEGHYDAVVADLPYGHMADHADAAFHDAIARHVVGLADRVVVISNRRIESVEEWAGGRDVEILTTTVSRSLARHFHVVGDGPA